MRLSDERIKSLQRLLSELGLNYNDEQTQEAGMAILRFVIAKAQRKNSITKNKEIKNDTIIT